MEPTMQEIAEMLRKGATRCEDLRDVMDDRGEISISHYYAKEAHEFRIRAAQVEAMGERWCENCERWNGPYVNWIEWKRCKLAESSDMDLSMSNLDACGPNFGCRHWKRKEGGE